MTATTGTKSSAWFNLAVGILGVLQATDITPILGHSAAAGYGLTAIALANTVLHLMTGNTPIVGAPTVEPTLRD